MPEKIKCKNNNNKEKIEGKSTRYRTVFCQDHYFFKQGKLSLGTLNSNLRQNILLFYPILNFQFMPA